MGKVPKKRRKSTDTPNIKRTADSKKQKLQDFTEIEFKFLLKDETTVFDGEYLSDNRFRKLLGVILRAHARYIAIEKRVILPAHAHGPYGQSNWGHMQMSMRNFVTPRPPVKCRLADMLICGSVHR